MTIISEKLIRVIPRAVPWEEPGFHGKPAWFRRESYGYEILQEIPAIRGTGSEPGG